MVLVVLKDHRGRARFGDLSPVPFNPETSISPYMYIPITNGTLIYGAVQISIDACMHVHGFETRWMTKEQPKKRRKKKKKKEKKDPLYWETPSHALNRSESLHPVRRIRPIGRRGHLGTK